MLTRRLLLLGTAITALALPAPASAIVHGTEAAQGEFPAQGVLRVDTDGNDPDPTPYERFCGGTLIGSRQFLTAASCTVDDFDETLPEANFLVRLGNVDRSPPADVADDYGVATIELTPGVDAAILTLDRPADYQPTRVVDRVESTLWKADTLARVLGWGRRSTSGQTSQFLLKADVPIVDDARCSTAYGSSYDSATMVCAADPVGTPLQNAHDSCFDDTGGPLLVPDDAGFALAGIVSRLGADCGNPVHPGVYTQLGDGTQNEWIHRRTPEADFGLSHQPRANEPVTLRSTSRHPQGPGYYTTFRWDLDDDGAFDDATGKTISHAFPTEGEAVAGLEASKPGGDKASIYYRFAVEPDPNAPQPAQTISTTTAAPAAKAAPLATILAAKRPKVKRGRFSIRVRFAKAAPSGTAVIEVYRGTRRIGIARTKVKRGATKRVRVKLTPTGRRILRRAKSKRLKIRVRVRVGRQLLRTKQLTIRR